MNMSKKMDLVTKKKLQKNVDSFILMNNTSCVYLEKFVQTALEEKRISEEEKINFNNLVQYLESLTIFYKNLIPK